MPWLFGDDRSDADVDSGDEATSDADRDDDGVGDPTPTTTDDNRSAAELSGHGP